MSVSIQVTDANGRPRKGLKVYVGWTSGGTSSGTTDQNGIIDTGVRGPSHARYVTVDGKEVLTGFELQDGNNSVRYSY